ADVREIGRLRETGDVRYRRRRTSVDHHERSGELNVARFDDALAGEGRLGVDYLDARVGQPFRGTVAKRADDVAHAVHHEREIDVDARVHAEVLGPARAAGVMCRAQERLRGRTPVVDAAAADVVALDKHHAT